MSETTVEPTAAEGLSAPETPDPQAATMADAIQATEISIPSLLEAGVHFGHQTHRWNPQMKRFIFGERNGTHIIDLDQTLPLFRKAIDRVQEVTAEGKSVLFVGTKRQAAPHVMTAAQRAKQPYVNSRWLGGMLTNWKTVKKSIDDYKNLLEIQADEEKRNALSKKELARVNRAVDKYAKSLAGMREMARLPAAIIVIDVGRESIAVSEAKRLGISVIGIVDSNCSPNRIDFPIPGNDDAIRAIELYCNAFADACAEGAAAHAEKLASEPKADPEAKPMAAGGRRVVEIKQAPRRGRGAKESTGSGRTRSSGGWNEATGEPAAGAKTPSEAAEAKPETEAPSEAVEAKPETEAPSEAVEAKPDAEATQEAAPAGGEAADETKSAES